MKIEHNAILVKEFADRILSHHYKQSTLGRKGWHRSDAISCPVKAYWRITGKLEGDFRSRDVGILLLGEMAHIVLERGFDAQEKVIELNGIQVTVDALYGKFPVEIKTTRKQIYRREDLPREWIEQLSIAMAVMDCVKGYLMVLNIINFALTVWEFTLDQNDREMFKQAFIWQILCIADSIEKAKPELLTPKYEDCNWCYYRPSKAKEGCPFYKPTPRK